MAFETKYRIVGSSDVFQKITILIKEDGFAGSITDFEGAGRDFARLKIGTSSSDISACVLPSEFSFKFYAMTDFVAIELAQGQMYSFLIEVLDHLDEIIWTGWVSPEDYSEEYVSTPYVVNVRATDMLDGLKNVALGTLFGTKNTLFEVLRTALAGTRLDLRYLESISIYSNGMLSTQDDSPLTQAEVTNDTWTNFSCYDVLEAILKPFFSRVYQYRGWVIENITFKRDNYILRLFDKFGVYQSSFNSLTLKTLQNTPVDFSKFLQKSGVLNFKPALNKSKVYFFSTEQVQDSSGLTGFDKLSDWTDANNLVSWTNENGIVILRVVTEYNGSQYAVWIDGRNTSFSDDQYIQSVAYPVDPATEEDIQVSFDYKMNYPSIVILGSKPTLFFEVYLDASGTGYWWTGTEWVTTRKPLRISASPRKAWRSYEITIPTLPAAGNIYFRLHKLVKSGSEGVTEVFLTKWVSNLKAQTEKRDVYFFSQGETSVETSYKGPVFEHYISDGDVLETKGVMEVSGVLTETWNRISESEDLDIKALFLLQWLSMNQYPTAVLQGTLYQKGELIRPTDTIRDDALVSLRRYIMTMWDINISNGIGNIVYREIPLEDVSGVLVTEGTAETIDQGEYLLPGSLPASAPSIPVFGPNTPVIIPTGIRLLNGDVTGDLSAATLTPSAIVNKARLDTTGLTPAEILINAVKDTPDQESMTNMSLSDVSPLLQISPFQLTSEGADDGDVLTWVAANSRYEPVVPSGGGGISDAPNDGLAYTRKSLGWTQLSPYDLKQEGATDGQLLAWNTTNSRYQPVTSGEWLVSGDSIYRNGRVIVGATTGTVSSTFTVRGFYNNSTYKVLDVFSFAGSPILSITDNGQFSVTQFGTNGASFSGVVNHIKSTVNSSAPALRISNLAGTVMMDVQSGGFVVIPGRIVVGGTSVVSGAWNSIRSGGSTVGDSCLSIVNLANTLLFDMRSNGQLRLPQVKAQTTDPMVANALWNDGGILKFSAA